MVLNHLGNKISLEKTTAELSGTSVEDVSLEEMAKFASRFFPPPRVEKSSLCDVIGAISAGNPVILYLDLSESLIRTPRYIVAVGYDIDKQVLVFHNGYSDYLRAPFELIHEKWAKAGTLALYIDR